MRFLIALAAALGVALSARAAPPLEAYGRLPAISAVALSPSGERFAVAAADGKGGWNVIVRSSTGAPVAALGFKTSNIQHLEFAGEDHLLVFETALQKLPADFSVVGRPDFVRLDVMEFNLKTHASYLLLRTNNGILWPSVFGWHGVRQVGGRWYAYVGGILNSSYGSLRQFAHFPDLYRVDLETGKPELVSSSGGHARGWLVGQDGKVVASTLYEPSSEQWTLFVGSGTDHPIGLRKGADYIDVDSLGRTPGTLLIEERTNEATTFREVRADSQGDGAVLASGEAATAPITHTDTGLLAGLTTVKDQVLFEPALQKRIGDARKAFPGDRARLVAYSRNFDRMIFFTDGPKNAGRYWLVDVVARSAAPLGDVRPEISPEEVGPIRVFAYKASDGLAMEGVLTLPPKRDPKSLPLVVMPHGGPIAAGDQPGFDWWAQAFASRGYAVFQPNFRGSLGYGDGFRAAANGEFGRKMQSDVSDGVAALVAAGVVDKGRVCIVGASYGGYAALAGVTLQHGLYRCAVSVAGISDVDQMLYWSREHFSLVSKALRERQWRLSTGAEVGDNGAVSPLRMAGKADAPVLLIHGEDDITVPVEQSRAMQKALAGADKSVEFIPLKDAEHSLETAGSRQIMVAASVAFVEKHNPAN